jgi:hypothetical protein
MFRVIHGFGREVIEQCGLIRRRRKGRAAGHQAQSLSAAARP